MGCPALLSQSSTAGGGGEELGLGVGGEFRRDPMNITPLLEECRPAICKVQIALHT